MSIVAAGKDRGTPTAEMTGTYLDRASGMARGLGIDGPSLHVIEAPKALSGPERQAREAELLLGAVPPGDGIILLEERGKNMKSRDVAALIERHRDDGGGGLHFMIGGADGFGSALTKDHPQVRGTLSFGAATWPHMLCRVMLAEQLYRAMTLLAGHPYHRD
ncbi:23S rRNA (pseudouridine(1915)-N(3))-methyltransferase RlmH [Parvularcula marina]|uniref:23S rRNA (pseudouridine(1915)-N(3))-methyltransferase RlmH n=1 Tax=Parvularcula marina TaxID=2292771 RepID=UPI0035162F49